MQYNMQWRITARITIVFPIIFQVIATMVTLLADTENPTQGPSAVYTNQFLFSLGIYTDGRLEFPIDMRQIRCPWKGGSR